jgi:hypothetical protein
MYGVSFREIQPTIVSGVCILCSWINRRNWGWHRSSEYWRHDMHGVCRRTVQPVGTGGMRPLPSAWSICRARSNVVLVLCGGYGRYGLQSGHNLCSV